MLYIVIILLVLFLVIKYDILNSSKNSNVWYFALLGIYICVSGFSYNVGSDIPVYMDEYDAYNWRKFNSLDYLTSFRHRQPGWVLLSTICKSISDDYVFFQFVSSVFFNCTFFWFIKKYSKAYYVALLFYSASIYLLLNFNILRQGYAICFFLIAYSQIEKKRYVNYTLLCLLAISFHSSAVICFFLPLFKFVKISKKTIAVLSFSLMGVILLFFSEFGQLFIVDFFVDMVSSEGITTQAMGDVGMKFMSEEYERAVSSPSLSGIFSIFITTIIMAVVAYYSYSHKRDSLYFVIVILLPTFLLLDMVIPVFFMRYTFYFRIFYYCALADMIVNIPRLHLINIRKGFMIFILVCSFCIHPIFSMFNSSSGVPMIRQYYPYYSVFNKQIDPIRARNFGYHR